jgi:hypothetical protein
MKKILFVVIALLMAGTGVFAQTKTGDKGSKSAQVVYTCPMHPEVKSDKPGKCPRCGMTLVKKTAGPAPAGKKGSGGKKDSASMKGMKM